MSRITLAVNPRRRRRTRRRRPAYFPPATSRRPRRRNPTLRIANPKFGGGVMDLIMPALMVSLGAVAGTVLPRTLKVVKPDASKTMLALAAIATGVGLGMVGKQFLGRDNSKMLALGAMSAGVSTFLNQVLPPNLRISGIGQGTELVTEADVDAEIRRLAAGGIGDVTQDPFSTFAGVEDYAMSTLP